jgi:hypothetical protein
MGFQDTPPAGFTPSPWHDYNPRTGVGTNDTPDSTANKQRAENGVAQFAQDRVQAGVIGSRPAAGAAAGVTYVATDTPGISRSDGSTWSDLLEFVSRTPVTFAIYPDGSNWKARLGASGAVFSTNSDPAAVLHACLNYSITIANGATVLIVGQPAWGSTPTIPANYVGDVRIQGLGDTKITLTTSGRQFLKFNRTADYQTFKNVHVSDLVIDCNGVGGQSSIVLGTYDSTWPTAAQRVNLSDMSLRRIKVVNAPTNADTSTDHRLGFYFVSYHPGVNEATQTYVKNIVVEDFDMTANGNAGGVIAGSGPVGGVNVLVDDIHLNRCKQTCARAILASQTSLPAGTLTVDTTTGFSTAGQLRCRALDGTIQTITYTGKTSTTFTGCTGGTGTLAASTGLGYPTSSNFQVGGRGIGGRYVLRDVRGAYSGDNNFEINAPTDALLDNVHGRDALNVGLYINNYQLPLYPDDQTITLDGYSYRQTDGSLRSVACELGPSTVQTLGRLVTTRCHSDFEADNAFAIGGSAINAVSSAVKEIVLDWRHTHKVAATLLGNTTPSVFWISPSTSCVVRGSASAKVSGTVTPGAFSANNRLANLSGVDTVFDDVRFRYDFAVTGVVAGSSYGLNIGEDASSVVRGRLGLIIDQMTGETGTPNPRGIRIRHTNLTLDSTHTLILDGDFTKMPSTADEFLFDNAAEKSYVYIGDVKWVANTPRPFNAARLVGDGTPEAVVAAPPGSTFQRRDGAAGTTLYVKESGTGNTGWRPMPVPGSARTELVNAARAVVSESIPYGTANTTSAVASGEMPAMLTGFRSGDVLTGIVFELASGSPVVTLAKAVLFDKTGVLLASSSSGQSTTQSGTLGAGQKTWLFSSPYTITADDAYYLAILMVTSSGTINMLRGRSGSGLGSAISTGKRLAAKQTGLSDVPSPAVFAAGTDAMWFAAY